MYFDIITSDFGPIAIAGNDIGITHIDFQNGPRALEIKSTWTRDSKESRKSSSTVRCFILIKN